MKKILWCVFFSTALLTAGAQNAYKMKTQQQDIAAITRALEDYYFRGIYTGDTTLLRRVMHPGTLLFADIKGAPYAKTLDQYLDGVAHRQSPEDSGKPFKGTVVKVEVINTIAVARVQVKMYDFNYQELLSFHKIENDWIMVSKLFTDVSE